MARVVYEKNPKEEWDERVSTIKPAVVDDVVFSEIFKKYLPKSQELSCIEIGAIPGNFLVYFHKVFGYKITGIDFASDANLFHKTMKINDVEDYTFIKGDFLKYRFREQFDVVTSFGFIEHFDDVFDVLERHVDLVKPGGYLVISLPNFRFLQHLYHYYFDRANLDIHNLNAMRIGYLKRALNKLGMRRVYLKYFGHLQVWRQETKLTPKREQQIKRIHFWISKHGGKLPTMRLYSSYIVLIYQKPSSNSVDN